LNWLAIDNRKPSPQHLVPARNLAQALLQRRDVQETNETSSPANVVNGTSRL
jgi:hypothetical protein